VHLLSERLLLDPGGALFWPREGVLALAGLGTERGALDRLAALLRRWGPLRVLLLGAGGRSARLEAMAASVPVLRIAGEDTWRSAPLVFREGPTIGARGEVSGHALPCFIADGARIVLPAFGAEAGEPDLHDPAVRALFPRGGRVFLPGRERLASFRLAGRFGP
jgi:uncharacterized protein